MAAVAACAPPARAMSPTATRWYSATAVAVPLSAPLETVADPCAMVAASAGATSDTDRDGAAGQHGKDPSLPVVAHDPDHLVS